MDVRRIILTQAVQAIAIASLMGAAFAADAAEARAPTPSAALIPSYDAAALTQACNDGLAHAQTLVDELAVLPLDRVRSEEVFAKWDRLRIVLEDAESPADLLSNVSPDEKTRAAGDECQIRTTRFETDIRQNEALYARIKAAAPKDAVGLKLRKDLLDQFEDAGIALAPEKRARLKAILDRLEEIRQEFERNVRDNKTRLAFTAEEVKGLPQDYLDRAKRDDKGNYLLGFEYPEYVPFMANADDEGARRRYQFGFQNRGTPRNMELLAEAILLRKEMADLFGLPSYAHYATRRRMVVNPKTVDKFLVSVKSAVREVERSEITELTAFKAQSLNVPVGEVKLNRWDLDYYQEKLKKTRYGIDQEALRKYFPTEASIQWVMGMSGQLYGVRFVPAKVPVWNDEVRYFDLFDSATGKFLSGVYLDPFPREGKYTHAAAWPYRSSSTLAKRTPISVLVANLDRKGLTSEELETLVHEFGHVLHGVLSNTKYATQGGTSVELDFVEAPSQMYEEWARRKESLALLPAYCNPACPAIDEAMLQRLSQVHMYGSGVRYSRQHLYAAYDMAMSAASVGDPQATWEKMEGDTPLGYVPGYAAGYYSYMWSEVLALDMLSAYGGNLMDPAVGRRFRSTILAQGSQRRAKAMVHHFLGRDPTSAAFIAEITGKRRTAKLAH